MKPIHVRISRFFELSSIVMSCIMLSSPLVLEIASALGVELSQWPLTRRLLLYAVVVPVFGLALLHSVTAYRNRFLVIDEAGLRIKGPNDKAIPWADIMLVEEKDASMREWRRILIVLKDGRRINIDGILNYDDVRSAISQCRRIGRGDASNL